MNTEEKIALQLKSHPVLLYMKGVPEDPQCGFSARTVQALQSVGVEFSYVDVLKSPFIRERLPGISHWPTFPQLFVKGHLIGGCDIIEEELGRGSLRSLIDQTLEKEEA